jgi:hypothetical protein
VRRALKFLHGLGQEVTLAWVRHTKSSFPRDPNRDTLGRAYEGAVYVVGKILLQVTCSRQKEIVMGDRFSGSIITAAIAAAAVSVVISVSITGTLAQAPAVSGAALKTPWGEPDLQGIWTDEFDTSLQRPPRYANQEFFTEEQRADLDKARTAILTRFATERVQEQVAGLRGRKIRTDDLAATRRTSSALQHRPHEP